MLKIAQEIELRGPLNRSKYQSLLKFLRKNGKFVEHRRRANYMFDHPKKQIDLRVRDTNGNIEMVLKVGHLGAHRRKEITFDLGKIKLDDALAFLFHLGYRKGMTGLRISDIFQYRGIEFAVVKVPSHSYYFEVEKSAKTVANVPKLKKQLLQMTKKLSLRIFGKKEYDDYLDSMNRYASKRFLLKK